MSTSSFDQKAATWDDNPSRQELMRNVADAMADAIPLQENWRMLDYGCGTATLSVMLQDKLSGIIAADASAGMVAQARRKLDAAGLANIETVQIDLCQESLPSGSAFDLIATAMCLHHVEDIAKLGQAFSRLLPPGGWLAIADLYPEDGSFHDDPAIPHCGFDPGALGSLLAPAGFEVPAWRTVHRMHRNGRDYPVFLLTLRRTTLQE